MRRFFGVMTCMLLGASAMALSASAQFFQPRGNATPAPVPSVNRIEVHRAPRPGAVPNGGPVLKPRNPNPGAAARAPVQVPTNNVQVHSHRNRGGFYGWSSFGGAPLIVGSFCYTPIVPLVAAYPVFMPTAVMMPFPTPVPVPTPAAVPFNPAPEFDDGVPDPPKPKLLKSSTPEQKATAGKYLGYGDTNFAKQKYLAALERYKTAGTYAADLPDPFLRQGFAFAAMGQYENAVRVFRRGLKIRADWGNLPFQLDQLYGGDNVAKSAHMENIKKAIEANPLDSNPLFTLGMLLQFDGQHAQADGYFSRAASLGANTDGVLNGVLGPRPGKVEGEGNPPQPGKVVF